MHSRQALDKYDKTNLRQCICLTYYLYKIHRQ